MQTLVVCFHRQPVALLAIPGQADRDRFRMGFQPAIIMPATLSEPFAAIGKTDEGNKQYGGLHRRCL